MEILSIIKACYNNLMIIIVGLGNPGRRYRNTPHNLGFEAIDRLRKKHHLPRFRSEKMNWTSQGLIAGQPVLLAKPLTFMNNSGVAVAALAKEYQIPPDQIWLIHDEAALPLGQIKSSLNHSPGGHKGVASVYQYLNTSNILRFRLGSSLGENSDLKDFVLRPYRRADRLLAKEMIEQLVNLIEAALDKISVQN